jgi:phosphoglycerate dehydrogenase-like enzyme
MKPKILLLEDMHPKAKAILEECTYTEYAENGWNGELLTLSPPENIELVYTQLKGIPQQLLKQLTNLKAVASPCTGVDHLNNIQCKIIHLDDAWKANEGREITSTAEHTWSLILQLAKMNRMQLKGKTLGIIGYGRIGQNVDKLSFGFDMRVVECNGKEGGWPLHLLLPRCDVITLHVPLNDETRGMIGKEQFDMMKPGALLVNTSRAEIVDGDALYDALKNKKIAGYADDFKPDYGGIEVIFKNVIRTPHIGGNCFEAREATDIYIVKKIKEYIDGNI